MCLTTVEQVFVEPTDTDWKVGYKCMERGDEPRGSLAQKYKSMFQGDGRSQHLNQVYIDDRSGKNGHFIEVKDYPDDESTDLILYTAYPTGYHLFPNFQDVCTYYRETLMESSYIAVLEVRYRAVTAVGTQNYSECVVAQEIQLVKELFPCV